VNKTFIDFYKNNLIKIDMERSWLQNKYKKFRSHGQKSMYVHIQNKKLVDFRGDSINFIILNL